VPHSWARRSHGPLKNPSTTDLAGNAFNNGAFRPIQIGHSGTPRVEHALRIFVEASQTSASDALFAEMIARSGTDARAHSAALRYSVGLAELPAALANLTEAPFVAPFGPPGDKALPAFRRAANLDPDDTWTWIVVALKSTDPGAVDRALFEAARSAEAQGDWRGLAFAIVRSIRAIGPVVLVFMIFAMCGAAAGVVAVSTLAGMKAVVAILVPLGFFSPKIAVLLAAVAGMAMFVPLGWIAVDLIRRGYEARFFTDTSIVFDSIWLFQTLSLFGLLFHSAGRTAWVALSAFVVYRLIVWLGLRPVAAAARRQPPPRLLLLRVFGFKRRTERLFDLLSARWRHAGPIALIAAPDLASRLIDPAKLLAFVSGRLKRRFIIEPADLERRVHAGDDRPDVDGSYRFDELFCGKDTWQAAVLSLMGNCDLVAMDLRGFSPDNKGCVFELQSLVAHVPLGKIMLLTDATTDIAFLGQTLDTCWHAVESRSARAGEAGSLVLLDTKGRDLAVDTLMALANEALGRTASLPAPIGTTSLTPPRPPSHNLCS
jgi:hypothetical protein